YFRTTDVTGVCTLPGGGEMVMPGDNVTMAIELIQPIGMEKELGFGFREGGGEEGDAGGKGDDGDRADPADRDGEGVAVCDSGRGADGGRRRRSGDHGVAHARHHLARLHALSATELFDDKEPADASRPDGDQEVLQVVPQAPGAQGIEVGSEACSSNG